MQKNVSIIHIFLGAFVVLLLFMMMALGYLFYLLSSDIRTNESWQNFKHHSEIQFTLIDHMLEKVDLKETPNVVTTVNGLFTDKVKFLEKRDLHLTEVGREIIRTGHQHYISSPTSPNWSVVYQLSNSPHYVLITRSDSHSLFMERFKWHWLVIPVLILGVVLCLGLYIVRSLVQKPIENIVKSADVLGAGNFDIRADTKAIVPIDRLAQCFNSIAEDLQRTFVEKEMMLAAIPHELKSPLARLSFMLEIGKAKKTTPEFIHVLSEIEGTVNELQSAINEVLDLTNLRDIESIETKLFSPYELCSKEIALLEEEASQKVELNVDPGLRVFGNCDLLARAFQNVLSNSVRYAASKCLVTISVESEDAILRVEDDGFGVPEEQQAAVFEAFTKVDLSRSNNGAGLGLGLAIVRVIMNKHGGTAKIKVSPLGGACIEMQWPAIS